MVAIFLRAYLLLVGLLFAVPATAVVRRYNQTLVYPGATSIPSWAEYDRNIRIIGNETSMEDDITQFVPLKICIPFFQSPEPLPMFMSSNGFLAPTQETLCSNFCSDQLSFTASNSATGKIPLIGLYVTDLNPGARGASSRYARVYVWRGVRQIGGEKIQAAVGEYLGVSTYAGTANLTAQVELWENGTIIMRYADAYHVQPYDFGDVGLIWTKRQRYVAPDVSSYVKDSPKIIAIRYDPMPDPCAVNKGCDTCAIAEGCAWCDLTSECVGTDVVDDVCSPTERNRCLAQNLTQLDFIAQAYYNTTIQYDVPFNDIQFHPNVTKYELSIASAFPITLDLGMNFSYYSFHKEGPNGTNPRTNYTDVRIAPDYTLTFGPTSERCLGRAYGLNGDSRGGCEDGAYRNTIALFGSPMAVQAGSQARVVRLPPRVAGDFMCEMNRTEDGCPASFVYQLTNALPSASTQYRYLTGQIILDADGTVTLHFKSLGNYTNRLDGGCANSGTRTIWYRPLDTYMGLFRNGNTDKDLSTVTLPWPLVAASSRFVATPIPSCYDCNGRGYCNAANLTCVCKVNYAGDFCEECAPGHYGPQCLPCEACANGGTCDDGLEGSGYCRDCTAPYGGARCDQACDSSAAITCPGGCGMGYCECGVCKCMPDSGWFGPTCSQWTDPCRKSTLYGCAACVSAAKDALVSCGWCSSTAMCEASPKAQQTVHIGRNASDSKCTSTITSITVSQCTLPTIRAPADSKFAVITIIVVFACLGVCSCLTLLTVCLCRKHPYNPLVLGAVPGVPDFSFTRREREIIGISRLPIQGRNGRPVQGIPLKQIPMRELVIMQRQRQKERAESVCPIVGMHVDHNGL